MTLLLALIATTLAHPPTTAVDGWTAYVEPPPATIASTTVAHCESGNRALLKNPASSASGIWQFLDGTWEWVTGLEPPARAYPRHIQRAAFDKLWNGGRGASHWEPSRYCWEGMQ